MRLQKILEPIKRRILLAFARGVIRLTEASLKCQEVQIELLSGEVRQLEQFQQYGFTSHAKRPDASGGCEGFVGFMGGNRDHGVCLGTVDRRNRPDDLEEGDVCVFNDLGVRIVLGRNNELRIKSGASSADKRLTINPTKIRLDSGDTALSIEIDDDAIILRVDANKSIAIDADSIVARMGDGGKRIELTEAGAVVDMGASGVQLSMNDAQAVLSGGPISRVRVLPDRIVFESPAFEFVTT